MKNIFKKIFLHAAAMFFLTAASYALPGVVQYIPDTSGEYVFYKDKSFKTETIVGFLYYNESTYAARIYSPANEKAKTTEKDITIYVNVDSSKAGFTMTGEKIDGSVDGNYELVNYLHDMLYEFAKRRQNITLAKEIKTVDDDFNQFGGAVKIKFNSIVPLFNIEGMSSEEVTERLSREYGIAVRGGYHCAPLAHRSIGTFDGGAVRLSVGPFNTRKEMRTAAEAIYRIGKRSKMQGRN